ncbi:MAG: choice-of-anchor I family protein [Cyanobacteriota bacterium]|nr:choice-of-anchor I family protein [Cyanobacteriota bacterium]
MAPAITRNNRILAVDLREPQSLAASAAGAVPVPAALTTSSPLPSQGSFAAVAKATAFPGAPMPAPAVPLLGGVNLSPDQTKLTTEQFQTEISTTVSLAGRMFVISSGGGGTLQVSDATTPAAITLVNRTALSGYTSQSVASYGNLLAVALSPADYSANGGKGLVRFYRLEVDGRLVQLADVSVGYLPDSIAFNANGSKLVIANEGEPTANYAIDRPGSIGIIDIQGRVNLRFSYTDLGFANVPLPEGLRLSGPAGTTAGNDIEPEYVSILGHYAYVTLQENNGVAKVNLISNCIEAIFALGTVDYRNQLVDLTDKDGTGGASIFAPKLGQGFEGLRMADGIAAFSVKGKDYFVTANEGDGRDYGTYLDEVRGTGTNPDTIAYRVKRLTDDATVGRPDRTTTFGGRGISVFDADTGALLWDSGNSLQTIAVAAGLYDDGRSDDKGVEPEGIVVWQNDGRSYAIVGMERTKSSMLAVFDITDPGAGRFVTSTVIAGSLSPEGLHIVDARQSPTGRAQLVLSNEISNSLNVFDLGALIAAPPVAGAGTFQSTMLKDVVGGPRLQISSLITNGEFTNGLNSGDPVFAPVGIFDGMGAYDNRDGTYTLLVNAEIGPGKGYGFSVDGLNPVVDGARISRFIIDKDVDDNASNGFQSKVITGGLAFDEVISPSASFVQGAMNRFCSANLIQAGAFSGRGFADTIFLMGEESAPGNRFFALDPNGGKLYHVPAFGYGGWESATAVDTGNANTVAVMLFDDASAPLYLWVGTKDAGSGDFLVRNGLAASSGALYAWKADGIAATPAGLGAVALNTPVGGEWVLLGTGDQIAGLANAAALRSLAFSQGAMQFTRVEDGDVSPLTGQQVVFNSTGGSGTDVYGSSYIIDLASAFDANGLLKAGLTSSLRVLVDTDKLTGVERQSGIRSQDNLAWGSDNFVYIQEDRSLAGGSADGQFGSEEASIWRVDPVTGMATRWAQIDRSAVPTAYGQTDSLPLDIGNWESSGIIDVSAIYGAPAGTCFLADVQAHSISNGNIGGASYLVEGGQIDLICQVF